MKAPKLDKGADAEAIFWDSWISDVNAGNGHLNHIVDNYIRIKIYTDRGVEKFGDVEIPYSSLANMSLTDVKARTIKPDGTIVDVPGSAFVDRTTSKVGKAKFKVRSFALRGLQPGAIIEYQYTEVYSEYVPRYVEMTMQRDIPSWQITKYVKPFTGWGFGEQMRAYPFNCNPSPWEQVRGDVRRQGFVSTYVKDVPAFIEEPSMPAEDDVRAWMLIYYTPTTKEKPDSYWPSAGRNLASEFRKKVKVSGEIKQLAQELTAKSTDPFDKANALAAYCQQQIRNVSYNADGVTSEMRNDFYKNLSEGHNSSDTLKQKMGSANHVLALFYALAEAAGLNPVYVRAGSSNSAVFRADFLDTFLLKNTLIAIPSGDQVRYYNPGVPYLPPGMADWDEQGQPAIFVDQKNPKLLLLPSAPPGASRMRRTAKLKISEEGKIEGTVNLLYTGYFDSMEKMRLEDKSAGTREEDFRKDLEAQFPGAKITNLKIDHATSTSMPLRVSYSIEMEGYGQRTGKRIFFQPAFFQYGEKPRFPAKERKYPVRFLHPFTEEDTITVEFPDSYQLDSPEIPGTISLGAIGSYELSAGLANNAPILTIRRNLTFGNGNVSYFDVKYYAALKEAWDVMHTHNTHTLTLKVK